MPELANIIRHLIKHDIKFVLVGGYAAIAHGSTMMTQDVDICLDFSTENLLILQSALADLHPVHRMTPQRKPLTLTPDNCQSIQNLYLDTDLGQLDCLSSIKGVGDYLAVLAASIPISLPAGMCRILSLDALIQAKSAMGRARDQEVVIQLRALREQSSETHNPPNL